MSEGFFQDSAENNPDTDKITRNEEANKSMENFRICLVGTNVDNNGTLTAAKSFNLPVITSENGAELISNEDWLTIFIMNDFEGPIFDEIHKSKHRIMGSIALQQAAELKLDLTNNCRPIYNYSMKGVVTCFTGIRKKDELTLLVNLIHSMGGSIRKDMNSKVTHLICNSSGGDKYKYAMTFRLTVIRSEWVYSAWRHRDIQNFSVTNDEFTKPHKIKPFESHKICFFGFTIGEHQHMVDVLLSNGGIAVTVDDPDCSHIVVDEHTVQVKPEFTNHKTKIVKADWFWYTIQNGFADELDYLFGDYLESTPGELGVERRDSLPISFNKRKRKRLSQIISVDSIPTSSGKRRSSVSDAGLLSVTGSFLDYTASPIVNNKHEGKEAEVNADQASKNKSMRFNHFMDLFVTESNYVGILHTIVTLFHRPLEDMIDTPGELLNKSEIKSIFNNFPNIHEVHMEMLNRFRELQQNWSEECLIGKIIIDHREALIKAYPPYVNYFEHMKEALIQCDTQNPRFHAFLKINQAKPECGRQALQDLMIRPVQRLPSISLLISDILKHTLKSNPDHIELDKALKAIKEVMTHINEDKRKTEGRLAMFEIFNHIDNCPPDLVSSHRCLVSRREVTELSGILSARDDPLMLFLFTDYIEVCKIRKSRGVKSPTINSLNLTQLSSSQHNQYHNHHHNQNHLKPYKHIKLVPLSTIPQVYDINDSSRAFALQIKDKLYSFSICEDIDKLIYLKAICKQLAENSCRTDAEQFLRSYNSEELGINITDVNLGTLKKAFNYARTRLKVTRAFSFNKTPLKLKRATSTTSPLFGSTNSLTPATQLAQMKLASCTNINEVGENGSDSEKSNNTGILVVPMSVQPTRKSRNSTLSALKRL